ncbi:hypothetical protein HRG_002358 [Hirsutella rhossiliensis]|uniref:Uncharacterized protein n=1 Tax=Hirsutella rhossiliensis TaxID=111463 RepID=A0A9P8SM44_9HYPO|nr:uncharacterized protein HRG_02358 [Hirsutella rhossiliensis]KAH0966949.1 hypothetical protein HRG_02358 [Hirsutella rhossiliensis]
MNTAKGVKDTKMEMRRKAGEIAKLMKKQLTKETLGKDIPAITESITPDMARVLHHGTPENSDNKTFQRAQQCLTSLQDLVRSYEILNQGSINTQEPTRTHWDQDEANLRALNESAMGVAFRILNGIVMPHANNGLVEDRAKTDGSSDIDTMATELLAEAKPQRGDVTWGMTARDIFRVLSGTVGLLPEAQQKSHG